MLYRLPECERVCSGICTLLADLMGHESIETTRIYLRRTASEQQKIVDKVVNW